MKDYPNKFSAGLKKKYASGGEVKKGVPSGWPGPGRGGPDVEEGSKNFDDWSKKMFGSKGTADDPHINTAPAEKVEYSKDEPEDQASEDDEEYRKGGPVKKRRK